MATAFFAALNTTLTLLCQTTIEKPVWNGPPLDSNLALTTYNYKGNDIGADFPRLSFGSNNRDLVITGVQLIDGGKYKCQESNNLYELIIRVPPALPIIYNTTSVSQGKLTVSGTEGTSLTLTCLSAGGQPQQTVNWYRGSVTSGPLQDGPPNVVSGDLFNVTLSYTFTPTSSDDGVTFICQSAYSGDPQLIRTTDVTLFLNLQPTTPKVTVMGTPMESSSSIPIAQCMSSGFRPPTVSLSWTVGGGTAVTVRNPTVEESTTTNTFSVTDTYTKAVDRADNMKTFSCSINHETLSTPRTASVTLNVQFPPVIATLTGTFTTVADGSIKIFTCESETSNPDANITWRRNNVIITSGTGTSTYTAGSYTGRLTTQTLTITPTRDDDGHVYSCSARNNASSSSANSQPKTLNLTYSPIVTAISKTVNETQPAFMRCLVSSKPPSTITWYLNNGQTKLLEGTGNNSLDYHIGVVSRDNAGAYKCTANNGIEGDNSSTVQLVVQYKPDVSIVAQNATENTTSTLQCNSSGVPDSYSYQSWVQTWPGSNIVLRTLPGSAVLTLNNLRYEHTGIYTCMVDNGVKLSRNPSAGQGRVFFVVKSRPFVKATEQTIQKAAQLGKVTTIQVEFVSNSPGTKISVEKRGNLTLTQSTLFNTTIMPANISVVVFNKTVQTEGFLSEIDITVVNQVEFGLYDIVIENDIGIEKRAVNLVPKGPPSIPEIVSITNVMETSALLLWKYGFHGGADQTVKVETSRDGTSWTPTLSLFQGMLEDTSTVNTTITELVPASLYYLRMFAVNAEGESKKTGFFKFTTKERGGQKGSPLPFIIGGAVGGTAAAAVIIVITVLLVRKFNLNCQGLKENSTRGHRLHTLQENQHDSDGDDEVINPIYDSQGNNETKHPSAENLYAQPKKATKKLAINPSDVYAEVIKGKKGKKKAKATTREEKDVYENSQPPTSDNNQVYSNEGFDKSEGQAPKKNVNKDGLLYADIVFANPPKGQKRLVIHGLDDMTEYATVDLTKKADPLSDSDEEGGKQ